MPQFLWVAMLSMTQFVSDRLKQIVPLFFHASSYSLCKYTNLIGCIEHGQVSDVLRLTLMSRKWVWLPGLNSCKSFELDKKSSLLIKFKSFLTYLPILSSYPCIQLNPDEWCLGLNYITDTDERHIWGCNVINGGIINSTNNRELWIPDMSMLIDCGDFFVF